MGLPLSLTHFKGLKNAKKMSPRIIISNNYIRRYDGLYRHKYHEIVILFIENAQKLPSHSSEHP